jgi:hypothetical protein
MIKLAHHLSRPRGTTGICGAFRAFQFLRTAIKRFFGKEPEWPVKPRTKVEDTEGWSNILATIRFPSLKHNGGTSRYLKRRSCACFLRCSFARGTT